MVTTWSCFGNARKFALLILSIYTIWDGLSLTTISRYYTFKSIILCQMILKTKLDDIKKAVVVGGPIPQVFKTLGS
jgi:hypothetical protein